MHLCRETTQCVIFFYYYRYYYFIIILYHYYYYYHYIVIINIIIILIIAASISEPSEEFQQYQVGRLTFVHSDRDETTFWISESREFYPNATSVMKRPIISIIPLSYLLIWEDPVSPCDQRHLLTVSVVKISRLTAQCWSQGKPRLFGCWLRATLIFERFTVNNDSQLGRIPSLRSSSVSRRRSPHTTSKRAFCCQTRKRGRTEQQWKKKGWPDVNGEWIRHENRASIRALISDSSCRRRRHGRSRCRAWKTLEKEDEKVHLSVSCLCTKEL